MWNSVRLAGWLLAILSIFGLLLYTLLPFVLKLASVQERLRGAVAGLLGPTVRYESLDFISWPRPVVVLQRVHLDLQPHVRGTIQSVALVPGFATLWRPQLSEVRLETPDLLVEPFPDAFQTPVSGGGTPPEFLHQAALRLQRLAGLMPARVVTVRDGRLRLRKTAGDPLLAIDRLQAQARRREDTLQVTLSCGADRWRNLSLDVVAGKQGFNADLSLEHFQPQTLWAAILPHTVIQPGAGTANLALTLSSTDSRTLGGSVSLTFPSLTLQRGRQVTLLQDGALEGSWRMGPEGLSGEIARLRLGTPALALSGHLTSGGKGEVPRQLIVEGRQLDLGAIREAALALAGEQPVVKGLFDVLRQGQIPHITLRGAGATWKALLNGPEVQLEGDLAAGTVHIPAGDLLCEAVSGHVTVSGWERIEGRALSARLGKSRGLEGIFRMDLAPDDPLWKLAIRVQADLRELPPILERVVEQTEFRRELGLLRQLEGEAAGRLTLDASAEAMHTVVAIETFSLRARHDRCPFPIEASGKGLDYADGSLALNEADGRVGGSAFQGLSGRIDWVGLPAIAARVRGADADLGEILPWIGVEGVPLWGDASLRPPKGHVALASASIDGPLLAPGQWRYQAEGRVSDLVAETSQGSGKWRIPVGGFKITPRSLNLESLQLETPEGQLLVSGALNGPLEHLQEADLALQGELSDRAIERLWPLLSLPPFLRPRAPLSIASLRIGWERGRRLDLEWDLVSGGGEGTELSGGLHWSPEAMRGVGLRLRDADSDARGGFALQGDRLRVDFDGRLAAASANRVIAALPGGSGMIEGSAAVDLPVQDPLRFTAQGRLAVEKLDLPSTTWPGLSIDRMTVEAQGEELQFSAVELSLAGNRFAIAGRLKAGQGALPRFDLDAAAGRIDLAALRAAMGGGEGDSRWPALEGTLRLKVDELIHGEYRLRSLVAHLNVEAGAVSIDIAQGLACGLSLPGRVRIVSGNTGFDLQLSAQDAPLDDLWVCLGSAAGNVEGRFDFKGRLHGQGPPEGLLAALGGEFVLTAGAGRLSRYNDFRLLRQLFALLNVTEIFRGNLPDLGTEGFAFQAVRAGGKLEQGKLKLQELLIDGQSIDIAASGEIDLTQRTLELAVLAAPLKTANFIVRNLPLVNDILAGTLVSVPVRVYGPLSNPEVTPLSPTLVGKGLLDIMVRTLKLPIRIVQPLISDPSTP